MLLYEKIFSLLKDSNVLDKSIVDLNIENFPQKDDKLSDLIYKLSCSTNQMWAAQEILYKIRFMSEEQFKNEYGDKIIDLHVALKRACDLNVQRAHLMDAIDKKILDEKRGF